MTEEVLRNEDDRRTSRPFLKALGGIAAIPLAGDVLITLTTGKPNAPFTSAIIEAVIPGL